MTEDYTGLEGNFIATDSHGSTRISLVILSDALFAAANTLGDKMGGLLSLFESHAGGDGLAVA